MTTTLLVPCENCGTEGRIYIGYGNDPNPCDAGPCPVCNGTGEEEVEAEPVMLAECDCCGQFRGLSRTFTPCGVETFACEDCQP